jgi:hypothetical protein
MNELLKYSPEQIAELGNAEAFGTRSAAQPGPEHLEAESAL